MARRPSFSIFCAGVCGLLVGSLVVLGGGRQITHEPPAERSEDSDGGWQAHVLSPPRGLAIEPMTRAVLIRRSLETFPAGYLTIIGIIQGVALGILMEQAHPLILSAAPTGDRAVAIGEFFVAFTTILVVSYEYLWFTTIMRWTPTAMDTLVPHALGVCEIAPMFLLERPVAWWISTACTGCAGALALINTLIRCTRESFDHHDAVYEDVRTLLKRQIMMCAAMSVTAVVTGVASAVEGLTGAVAATLPWVIALGAASLVWFAERTLHVVYKEYGLPRGGLVARDHSQGTRSSS